MRLLFLSEMSLMKKDIIMGGMLTFLACIPLTLYSSDGKHRVTSDNCSDYVFITGETNVNQFDFLYNRKGFSMVHPGSTGNYEIEIPVRDFEPGNPFMYKDFLTLLKADQYPNISISIPAGQFNPENRAADTSATLVHITIAGITRSYLLKCSVQRCADGFLIAGSEPVKLSDFQLKTVERLGGLIRLRDEIDVSFGFIVNFATINQITSSR